MDKLDLILQKLDKLDAMESEISKINAHLERIDERLDGIEEDVEITRGAVNVLVKWAEKVTEAMSFPLPKI